MSTNSENAITQDGSCDLSALFNSVVSGGYCIGCGVCTAVENSPIKMRLDELGQYRAYCDSGFNENAMNGNVLRVCPFSDQAENEDQIGRKLFGENTIGDSRIGYNLSRYAGYVIEGDFRARGSSGGLGKWILHELLRAKLVDSVIQVMPTPAQNDDGLVYRYEVMSSVEEARSGSKSVYYPVEMSEVLAQIRDQPGRYAITGIPCFIKGIRLLSEQNPIYKQRIKYCIGLICGHLKSSKYAEMIAWQLGVQPGELASIDFRKKLPGAKANEKGVEVQSINNNSKIEPPDIVQNLFGTNYNQGFFQYRACDFCDDVVGETADISVGDAWLPQYIQDGKGTSVIVVRNPKIQELVSRAIEEKRIHLEPLTADEVVQSQAGGFRQRRQGLAYRLYLADKEGIWRPKKRVRPKAFRFLRKRTRIYRHRTLMSQKSHRSFQLALAQKDFGIFQQEMGKLVKDYRALYKPTYWHRVKRGVQRRTAKLIKQFSKSGTSA